MEREKRKGRDRKYKGSRGAVTIFLVLILVPCIIIVCIFGDVSRVELSKAEAAGAGDLALYSLMAHFDDKLNDYYGLVASSQSVGDFYDTTEKYFTGMMREAGLEDAESKMLTAYLDSLRSGDITDFLQVDFVEPAEVGPLSDSSSLGGNAALLEDSIVEFMKYRGPVELVEKVIDRFSKMNITDTIEGAQKDDKIVEAKKEYAEAEGDILRKAYNCYLSIRNYADVYGSTGVPDFEKYQEYEKTLKKVARDFAKVTVLITKYYAATDGINYVGFPYKPLKTYFDKQGYTPKDVGDKVTVDEPVEAVGSGGLKLDLQKNKLEGLEVQTKKEDKYCINSALLTELLKDLDKDIQKMKTDAEAISSACGDLGDPTANSDVNPAMFCMHVQNAATNERIQKIWGDGENLIQRYAKLNAALSLEEYPTGNDLPTNWKQQIGDAMAKIEKSCQTYFSETPSSDTAYGVLVNRYNQIAAGTIANVQGRLYKFQSEFKNESVTIDQFVKGVKEQFSQIEKEVKEQFDRINTAISGGSFTYEGTNYSTISLDQLRQDAVAYKTKRDNWGSTIDSSGSTTDYAKSEKKEYQDPKDDSTKIGMALSENNGQAVTDLKTRLTNIRQDMQDFLDALKNFTYGGEKATALGEGEKTIQAGKKVIPTQVNKISLSLSQNEKDAANYHASLLKPSEDQVYKAPERRPGPTGNDPDLDTDTPELYALMKTQFGQKTTQEVKQSVEENEQKESENAQKAEEEKKGALKADGNYLKGKGGDLGSSGSGGAVVSMGNLLTGIIGSVDKLLHGEGDELRDELYVAEYIMDMFSHSAYNNEGQHRLACAEENVYTLKDFTDGGYSYGSTYEERWKEENPAEFAENKSLTNLMIDASHNTMNLGEVEYILFGDTSIDKNLEKMYGNIFAVRLALNTVSGFQNFYSGGNTTGDCINGFALAVMGATAGVIPAALTKCVIIGVLSIMESAHDVNRLKAGSLVSLYKDASDWSFGLSSKENSLPGLGTDPKDEGGLYYSDYLYFFLLAGVMSGGDTYASIVRRTGDLIQANMNKMGSKDFDLKKSQCFFKLSATIKVKPLFIGLPIVDSMKGVDAGSVRDSGGWCTYKVSFTRGYS